MTNKFDLLQQVCLDNYSLLLDDPYKEDIKLLKKILSDENREGLSFSKISFINDKNGYLQRTSVRINADNNNEKTDIDGYAKDYKVMKCDVDYSNFDHYVKYQKDGRYLGIEPVTYNYFLQIQKTFNSFEYITPIEIVELLRTLLIHIEKHARDYLVSRGLWNILYTPVDGMDTKGYFNILDNRILLYNLERDLIYEDNTTLSNYLSVPGLGMVFTIKVEYNSSYKTYLVSISNNYGFYLYPYHFIDEKFIANNKAYYDKRLNELNNEVVINEEPIYERNLILA